MVASCHGSQAKWPLCQDFKWHLVFPICSSPPKGGCLLPSSFCLCQSPSCLSLPSSMGRTLAELSIMYRRSRIFLFSVILFPSAVVSSSLLLWARSLLETVVHSLLQCNAVLLYASHQNSFFSCLLLQCLHITQIGWVRPIAFSDYEMTTEGPYYERGEDVGKTTQIYMNSAALLAQATK